MINLTTGHYIINFYSFDGTQLQSNQAKAKNLESAKQEAQATIDNSLDKLRPIHYTIDRRIVNSTDKD